MLYKDFRNALARCTTRDEAWALLYGAETIYINTDDIKESSFPLPLFMEEDLADFLSSVYDQSVPPFDACTMMGSKAVNEMTKHLTKHNEQITRSLLKFSSWHYIVFCTIDSYGLDSIYPEKATDPRQQIVYDLISQHASCHRPRCKAPLPPVQEGDEIRYVFKHRYDVTGLFVIERLKLRNTIQKIDKFSVLFDTKLPPDVLRKWILPLYM